MASTFHHPPDHPPLFNGFILKIEMKIDIIPV
jgi:hypothetical protein